MSDLHAAAQELMAEAAQVVERMRMSALTRLRILYTDPEFEFDTIANIAADLCQASVGAITMLDNDVTFCKAMVGLDESVRCSNRNESLCNVTVQTPDRNLVVSDALLDSRVNQLPWISGNYDVFRFYAGFPLVFDGVAVGTLCVVDRHPKTLSEEQVAILSQLASLATRLLEKRAAS